MKKTILILLTIFLALFTFNNIKADNDLINVKVTASFDDSNNNVNLIKSSLEYGDILDLTNLIDNNYNLVFYIVDGVIDNNILNKEFVVTNNLEIILVYTSSGKNVVAYVDHNGKYIDSIYSNTNKTEEDISKPDKVGYNFVSFNEVYSDNNNNLVKRAHYERIDDGKIFTITINDEQFNYDYNEIVEVTSTKSNFSHWEEDGKVISYDRNYSFSALYNKEIKEVTSNETISLKPIVSISPNIKIRLGYISKIGQVYLPEGYTLLEHGFLTSTDESLILDINNSNIVKSSTIHPFTNEYLTSINNDYTNIRGYAIYKDDEGNINTIYSSLVESKIYVEDFENRTISASYLNGSFFNNGVEFSYNHSRNQGSGNDDYSINSKGLMLRRASDSYLEIVFKNGLNSLSFDYRKAFTGNNDRQLEIIVNEQVIHTTSKFGTSGKDLTIHNLKLNHLNYRNEVVVKIKLSGTSGDNSQVTLDNIKWTEYGPQIEEIPYYSIVYNTDGGNSIENDSIKENKKITTIPIPRKDGFKFVKWLHNGEEFDFNTLVTENIDLTAEYIEMFEMETLVLDFGKSKKEGYDSAEVTFINGDNYSYTLFKQRAHISTSINSPHNVKGAFLVLGPTSVVKESYVEFNLSNIDDVSKVEFTLAPWSDTSFGNIKSDFELYFQQYVGNEWITLKDSNDNKNLFTYIEKGNYVWIMLHLESSGLYRIFYDAPTAGGSAESNTTQAITIDDFTVYSWVESADGNRVVFDYNYPNSPSNKLEIISTGNLVESFIPERLGYSFLGWYLGNELYDFTTPITTNIKLTAHWEQTGVFVTFDYGYLGKESTEVEVDINSKVNKPLNPTREGYNFIGWYETNISVDIHDSFDFNTNLNENIRLIAKWEIINNDPDDLERNDNNLDGLYSSLSGLTGEDLFNELRNILIMTHTSPTNYGMARYILDIADRHPHDDGMVLGIYDRSMIIGPWNHPNWEREHVWPNSKLGVDRADNGTVDQASDLHNLRAIIPTVNQRRGNRYFINTSYDSPIGHQIGSDAYYPGNEDIGDVARVFLYMVIRYDILTLTDDESLLRLGDITKNNNVPETAFMGKLSVLYQWHLLDPVDEFEINRNNVIASHQGNRNPFIDHPELFKEVWDYLMGIDQARTAGKIIITTNEYVVEVDYEFLNRKNKRYLN